MLIAYPLFLQKKIIGVFRVAAKLQAEWKSTLDEAPSPKKTIEIALSLSGYATASIFNLYATPTACVICVPRGELIV